MTASIPPPGGIDQGERRAHLVGEQNHVRCQVDAPIAQVRRIAGRPERLEREVVRAPSCVELAKPK